MIILPLSTSTLSLKFKTIFALSETLVALSAGLEEDKVGFELAVLKKADVGVVPNPVTPVKVDIIAVAPPNMLLKVVTLDASQLLIYWLKLVA